jgi:hypothetical protein|tara:strand:+ start:256 stop:522 length:267 start_codon:yes stop_codon:yes gene_type:complete
VADWQALFERSDETSKVAWYQMPPLTKWRVHLTLREFRFSLTAFLRALLLANHCTVPSLRMNINPVPGSITSPEKVQILCSGMMITYS